MMMAAARLVLLLALLVCGVHSNRHDKRLRLQEAALTVSHSTSTVASGGGPTVAAEGAGEGLASAPEATDASPPEAQDWRQWLLSGAHWHDWRFLLGLAASVVTFLLMIDCVIASLKHLACVKHVPNRAILCMIASTSGVVLWQLKAHSLRALSDSTKYPHEDGPACYQFVLDKLVLLGVFVLSVNVATCFLGFFAQNDARETFFANDAGSCFEAFRQTCIGSLFVRLVQISSWSAFVVQLGLVMVSTEVWFLFQFMVPLCAASSPQAQFETPAGTIQVVEFCSKHAPADDAFAVVVGSAVAFLAQTSLLAWIGAWKASIDLERSRSD